MTTLEAAGARKRRNLVCSRSHGIAIRANTSNRIPNEGTETRKLSASSARLSCAASLYIYSNKGTVVQGEKRGRTIGFPTANIQPSDDYLLPVKVFMPLVLKSALKINYIEG